MTQELTTQDLPTTQNLDQYMTAGELTKQARLIQDILEKVMVGPTADNPQGVHYGIVPGTKKPTLLQPGAEKICATFRLAPKYAVEDLSEPHNNFYRYRVICSLYTIRDGLFVGSACGESCSAEEKYQWEKAVCQEEWDQADPTRRRVKFKNKYQSEEIEQIQQVQRNAADLSNTILKISCKRAYVSATRSATAASDLLDVDLEDEAVADLAREQQGEQEAPKKPKAKASAAPLIPYGKHKLDPQGNPQRIDSPDVPLDYLQWMADKTAATLKEIEADPKHKRKNFKQQDQALLIALDAEILRRKTADSAAPATPGEGQTGKPIEGAGKPISDTSWAEYILMWENDWFDLYAVTKESFAINSGHELPAGKRAEFYDRMNNAINAASQK